MGFFFLNKKNFKENPPLSPDVRVARGVKGGGVYSPDPRLPNPSYMFVPVYYQKFGHCVN